MTKTTTMTRTTKTPFSCGFYIDSALAELRLDRALVLLIATGLLTAAVDRISRGLRRRTSLGEPRRYRDECC